MRVAAQETWEHASPSPRLCSLGPDAHSWGLMRLFSAWEVPEVSMVTRPLMASMPQLRFQLTLLPHVVGGITGVVSLARRLTCGLVGMAQGECP